MEAELEGMTVESAQVLTAENGDEVLIIRCTNGAVFEVGAWQNEGHPVQMAVERRV